MSEASDRLAQTRLAIIAHVQQKKENRSGGFRGLLRSAAAAVGFTSPTGAGVAEDSTAVRHPAPLSNGAGRSGDPVSATSTAAYEATADTSRAAIENDEHAPLHGHDSPAQRHERRAQRLFGGLFGGRFSGLGEAGREYWRTHPARLVLELATPTLSSYAQRQPLRFLAYSAAAGALLYLARPWRLMSVTGLAVAALRSPQLSSALISALYGKDRAGGGAGPDTPE